MVRVVAEARPSGYARTSVSQPVVAARRAAVGDQGRGRWVANASRCCLWLGDRNSRSKVTVTAASPPVDPATSKARVGSVNCSLAGRSVWSEGRVDQKSRLAVLDQRCRSAEVADSQADHTAVNRQRTCRIPQRPRRSGIATDRRSPPRPHRPGRPLRRACAGRARTGRGRHSGRSSLRSMVCRVVISRSASD